MDDASGEEDGPEPVEESEVADEVGFAPPMDEYTEEPVDESEVADEVGFAPPQMKEDAVRGPETEDKSNRK